MAAKSYNRLLCMNGMTSNECIEISKSDHQRDLVNRNGRAERTRIMSKIEDKGAKVY